VIFQIPVPRAVFTIFAPLLPPKKFISIFIDTIFHRATEVPDRPPKKINIWPPGANVPIVPPKYGHAYRGISIIFDGTYWNDYYIKLTVF